MVMQSTSPLKITVVIPTYNEAGNLPTLIPALFDLPLPALRVLIVDDHSPDGTGQIADDLAKNYPDRITVLHRPGKMGLGSAYIQGFQVALKEGAEAVGEMDADFSHDPQKLPELAIALEKFDIALGSRYVPGGNVDQRWSIWRKWLSAFGNFYARKLLNLPVHDVTGGYRLYSRNSLLSMPLSRIRSNGYIFQVEMTTIAQRMGFSFCEVPIYFADRRWGKSKMSFRIQVEAAFRVWVLMLRYRNLK